jgi:hypothetical protein
MARGEWTRIDRDGLEHLVAMLLCRGTQRPNALEHRLETVELMSPCP